MCSAHMQGAFASRLNVPAQLLAPVPAGVDPVGAATLPAAALTARLAFDWARLKAGDRVLIHAASGGVGMAAIQLARQHGATVFATASAYKRATLREMGVEYVYDSRTTEFADQILADTNGEGVDVVLNSLTNEGFIEATVRATAKGGRFAEIAKRDIWTAEQMTTARPDIDYGVIALDVSMMTDPDHIKTLMTELSDGLAIGAWTPVPAEVYPLTEARSAFRRMQQARHIGKIVVQMPKPLRPRGSTHRALAANPERRQLERLPSCPALPAYPAWRLCLSRRRRSTALIVPGWISTTPRATTTLWYLPSSTRRLPVFTSFCALEDRQRIAGLYQQSLWVQTRPSGGLCRAESSLCPIHLAVGKRQSAHLQ